MKKLKRCLPVIVLAGVAISANAQDAVTGNQFKRCSVYQA